ncbi:hypothetical protein O181_021440 [Austropuccinia psidii MF-1]|uniref:Uncharacterized protein n=1 Tax=Austropuccinia psidii MF-1 TaxID=1389203 RepID=A0A9Q3CFR1_9BASI|nr:hypothetical protein [Austropuccinia psidii MF-1]
MKTKPNQGKGYTGGNSCLTEVLIDKNPTKLLVYLGAFCSCVGKSFLTKGVPNFKHKFLPIDGINLNSASNPMKVLGIFETTLKSPDINGNFRMTVGFFVMENCYSTQLILGNGHLIMYGIDSTNNKDRYLTNGYKKHQTFSFSPLRRHITVNKVSPVSLALGK